MKSGYRWLSFALLFFFSDGARANSEHYISSANGQRPYLIVMADEQGTSKRTPGIYVADSKGQWNPILEGAVLTGRISAGILAQLQTTQFDQRYGAIAVIDGKFTIFHINTELSDPASRVELGTPEHPYVDVLHNQEIPVPPVQSIDDIHVYTEDATPEGQLVLASVRLKPASLHGDGVTFAFFVKTGDPKASGLELAQPPVVVDYRFQNENELRGLVHDKSEQRGVISRLLLQSLTRRVSTDPIPLRRWKDEIKNRLADHKFDFSAKKLPYLDVREGTVKLPEPITDEIGNARRKLFQVYDPLRGHDGIVFSDARFPSFVDLAYDRTGRMEVFSSDVKAYRFYPNPDVSEAALAYFNRSLTFIYDSEVPYFLSLDKPTSKFPEAFAYHVVKIKGAPEDVSHFYFAISTERNGVKNTEALILKHVGNSFEIEKRYPMLPEFFSAEELQERLVIHQGEVLFDTLTPKQKSIAAYRQIARPTIPYLNVTRSQLPMKFEQAYREALDDRRLGDFAAYRTYDHRGARVPQSGLYFNDAAGLPVGNTKGELLLKEGQGQIELHSRSLRFGNPETSARLAVVALDAGFEHGANGFKLAGAFFYEGHPSAADVFLPAVEEFNFNFSFERLAGISILQGGAPHSETIYLVLRIEASKDGSGDVPAGGVYSIALNLAASRKKDRVTLITEKGRTGYLLKQGISETELRHRLRRETTEGKVYLATDKEINPQASNYRLVDLTNGNDFFPNLSGDRTKNFIAEEADDKTDGKPGFGKVASWEVHGAAPLKERFPKLLADLLESDAEKKLKEIEQLFPGLQEVLDGVADPAQTARRQVFILSAELKEKFQKTMLYLLADRERSRHFWSLANYRAKFSFFDPQKASQIEVMENLAAARNPKNADYGVLVADVKDVLAVGRPSDVSRDKTAAMPFHLTDPTKAPEEKVQILPHLLYMISTEGEAIDLPEFEKSEGWVQKTPTVLVATPDEWSRVLDQAAPEVYAGLGERFEVNTTYFSGDWMVRPPGTMLTSPRVHQLQSQPVSEFENEVFPTLGKLLHESADPGVAPKHRVLIVPQELKGNVMNLVLTRWIHSDGAKDLWSRGNEALSLYQFEPGKSQDQGDILENLAALTAVPATKRGVLVADLNDLAKVGRASTLNDDDFRIQDVAVMGNFEREPAANRELGTSAVFYFPHVLYLLATEGRRLQLHEFEKSKGLPYRFSELLIGTAADWENLKKDLNPEGRTGLAESFEVSELPVPSAETRIALLKRVLDRPEIQGLHYQFDASRAGVVDNRELTQDEARNILLASIVNRCEKLARPNGKEVITSFIQYLNVFASSLVQDDMLRRRRLIDQKFAERLFSKVFSMPLNVETLPKEDPLVRLSSPDAVMELQAAGYEGRMELKDRVIQALRAQTKFDPVRPIPSSIILYGDTRSGKTFLFVTLCKMLGLQMYDFARPNDPSAQAIIINVGKLRPNPVSASSMAAMSLGMGMDKPAAPANSDAMTVDEAMKHLQHFLSLPNGFRGYILLDDLHFATDEVRGQIITMLRGLFEVGSGMYRVTSLLGKTVDIPVRNLTLFVSLNPTDDLEKIRKFRTKGDDVEMVLASLWGRSVNVDRSFLERWSLLLNLSLFPVDAKAPKLRDSVRDAARETFDTQNRLVLVAPSTITTVVNQFSQANASFLSRATPELIARALELQQNSAMTVVIPKSNSVAMPPGGAPYRPRWGDSEASGRMDSEIEGYIRNSTVAVPVQGRIDGQLEFLKIIVDTFRIQVFEDLVKGVGQDVRYAGKFEQQRRLLAPMLHGVTAHLGKNAYLPVSSLGLDPYDFGATTRPQQERFRKVIDAQPEANSRYFPIQFGDELPLVGSLTRFVDHNEHSERERSRAHVLSETVDKLSPVFQEYLAQFLRVSSTSNLPPMDTWLRELQAVDSENPKKELGKKLADIFLDFYEDLFREGLAEIIRPQFFEDLTTYDAVRLFLLAIDKAITKLSWGKILGFLSQSMELATRDMALAQLQGVQHYIFNSKFSLIRPTTHDLLLQTASNSEAFRQWKDTQRSRASQEFQNKCPRLLVQTGT